MNTVFAIDALGRTRELGENDVLRDGERIRVPLLLQDAAQGPRPFTDSESYRIAGEAIARQRGGRVSDAAHGAYCAMKHLMDYRNRSAR
ncbi:MAG: hypothetical protein H4O13_09765 [Xanthomonadales bacterium]|nr:hypothetical protein [Xanthomonadales bacterium]